LRLKSLEESLKSREEVEWGQVCLDQNRSDIVIESDK
jgi:hypothetical protein